jgi:hypothetical protein
MSSYHRLWNLKASSHVNRQSANIPLHFLTYSRAKELAQEGRYQTVVGRRGCGKVLCGCSNLSAAG